MARWKARYKPSTAYSRRCALVRICHQLEQFHAPQIRPPKLPPPSGRTTVATGKELLALFDKPAPYLRLFMLLYLQAGLRFSETLRATPSAYNEEKRTLTLIVKGGRQRRVDLTEDVTRLFAAVDPPADTPYIFALRGRTLTNSGLNRAWRKHRALCGVSPLVTAHDLRRTAATIVYEKTHDLRAAQQLLGHKNLVSTLSYLAPLHPDEARRYAELLQFDKFKSEVKQ